MGGCPELDPELEEAHQTDKDGTGGCPRISRRKLIKQIRTEQVGVQE
jgi:hypothetical protein